MNRIIYFYFFIVLLLISLKPKVDTDEWKYKYVLIYLATSILTISLFVDNNIINKYILPFLIFLNVLILIPITLVNKPNIINMLSILAVLVILITFNYKELEIKRGIMVNLNKKWLLTYVFGLSLYFMLSNYHVTVFYFRIFNIILLVYPLLFPTNEYFIHRAFSLTIGCLYANLDHKLLKIL